MLKAIKDQDKGTDGINEANTQLENVNNEDVHSSNSDLQDFTTSNKIDKKITTEFDK